MSICRHCRRHVINRPYRLCYACYFRADLRDRYADEARTSGATPPHAPDVPIGPTASAPGTEEKIAVLTARVAAGVYLWHPCDAIEADGERSGGGYHHGATPPPAPRQRDESGGRLVHYH